VKDWGSVESLKYQANLIPEKCKAQCDFIAYNNAIIGYGDTMHHLWAFDPSLLDSTLCIPSEDQYLDCAQEYLDYQISRARDLKVKTFRAFSPQGNDFMRAFYINNGFTISQVEFISMLSLDEFKLEDFPRPVAKFRQSSLEISNLKEL
jgi:hypothetical protein